MSLPPAKKVPKTQADPLVAAAQELGAEVRELPPDANKRLDIMWHKHITPALAKLAEKDAELAAQITAVYSKLSDLRATLAASLYDPTALVELTESIKANEAVIAAFAGRKYDVLEGKLERDEKRRDLRYQADDVERPIRVAVRNETYTNEADKLKFTYPNDPARADELADRLAASDGYQVIAGELDKLDKEDAFMRSALEELESERTSASKLLYSQGLRLQNLTARLLNPTPLGGNDD